MGKAQTLFQEIKLEFKRWRGIRKKELLPLKKIYQEMMADINKEAKRKPIQLPSMGIDFFGGDAEEEAGEDEEEEEEDEEAAPQERAMATVPYLIKVVDNISQEQAERLLRRSIEDYYRKNAQYADLDELRNLMKHVNHRTKKLKKIVRGDPTKKTAVAEKTPAKKVNRDLFGEMR